MAEEIKDVKPKQTKRTASKRAKKATPQPVDTRLTCAVCGTKSAKMFARVGENEWVCCPQCLARFGKTRA